MKGPVNAYVGLGSNLGNREKTLREALEYLQNRPEIHSIRTASLIETTALSPVRQPPFLNTAAEIFTTLEPFPLLRLLQETEEHFGRRRKERWGPRTLDLDLLLYNDTVLNEPDLILPHPHMHLRSFVLKGMVELNPDLHHPLLHKTMRQLAARLNGGNYTLNPQRLQLISVAGLIGVGKTTLARRLAEALGGTLIREEYDKNPFLEKVYDGQRDLALDSELFFLSSSATQLRKDRRRRGGVFVSDYAFIKALMYARLWLNREQLDQYMQIYDSVRRQVHQPVLMIFLEDTVDNCLERIHRRKRPYEQGIEPDFLKRQKNAYEEIFDTWKTCPLMRLKARECADPQQVQQLAQEVNFYLARRNPWKS